MNNKEVKEELLNRYIYLYKNSSYILSPYICGQTKEDRLKINKHLIEEGLENLITNEQVIYLNTSSIPISLLLQLESFLLSDTKVIESELYMYLEEQKNNKEYLEKVKIGIKLDNERNSDESYLNINTLFSVVINFIETQTEFLGNKQKKLDVMDEYYRVLRYKNDSKIWISGHDLNFYDINNYDSLSYVFNSKNNISKNINKGNYYHIKRLKETDFIKYVANRRNHYDYNLSIFTEEEKQNVYLLFNNELPWDLEIECKIEDNDILERPMNTKSCNTVFYVNEDNIFINSNDSIYKYYQLCPNCGYMVNIPNEILSEDIKKRIEKRCTKDNNLFRKMYLYSELYSLEKDINDENKRLTKKNFTK